MDSPRLGRRASLAAMMSTITVSLVFSNPTLTLTLHLTLTLALTLTLTLALNLTLARPSWKRCQPTSSEGAQPSVAQWRRHTQRAGAPRAWSGSGFELGLGLGLGSGFGLGFRLGLELGLGWGSGSE